MVPEVFEEVNENLLLDVMWLHTVCHTALLYHLGNEGRRGEGSRGEEGGREGGGKEGEKRRMREHDVSRDQLQ